MTAGGRNFSPLCCLIFSLIFCCLSSLPTLGEPLHTKPSATGGKVVAPVQVSSPGVGCSRKDTVFHGAVSLAQALIWERVSLTAELKLSPCFVYASVLPGLCLLLGWKCPAKTSGSPRRLRSQQTSRLFDESSALDRQRCLRAVWRL